MRVATYHKLFVCANELLSLQVAQSTFGFLSTGAPPLRRIATMVGVCGVTADFVKDRDLYLWQLCRWHMKNNTGKFGASEIVDLGCGSVRAWRARLERKGYGPPFGTWPSDPHQQPSQAAKTLKNKPAKTLKGKKGKPVRPVKSAKTLKGKKGKPVMKPVMKSLLTKGKKGKQGQGKGRTLAVELLAVKDVSQSKRILELLHQVWTCVGLLQQCYIKKLQRQKELYA